MNEIGVERMEYGVMAIQHGSCQGPSLDPRFGSRCWCLVRG